MTQYEVTTPASMATYVNRRAPVAWFSSVSSLLADTTLAYAAGTITVSENDVVGASGYLYRVAASGASDEHVTTAGGVKLYALAGERGVSAAAFGLPTGGDDQTLMNTLINSSATAIYFPPGVYRANIDNTTGDRTFFFDEGAIVDGIVHIAIGVGPEDVGAPALVPVENVRVIGTLASTVRVGTYYAKRVNIDKIRIVATDAGYVNQTAEGGTKGVHLYYGSHDFQIGEIVCDETSADLAALRIDANLVVDADHKPTNIHIGKFTSRASTVAVLRTYYTVGLKIEQVDLTGYATYNCFELTSDDDIYIGSVTIDGTGSGGSLAGFYVLNGISGYFQQIKVHDCSSHGFYLVNSPKTRVGYLETYNNGGDGARLNSTGFIDRVLSHDNTGVGLFFNTADGSKSGFAEVYDNGTQGVYVNSADDVTVDEIYSHGHVGAAGYGVFINASARFKSRSVKSDSNVQGVRYIGNTDCDLGIISASGNSSADVALGGTNSGFSMDYAEYSTISGGYLQAITNFHGRLAKAGSKTRGDESVTLTRADAPEQRFGTTLTADRTVTLPTSKQPGDQFRIIRTGAGAFNLSVDGLKTLSAANQWCDVKVSDTNAWYLSAYGTL